MNDNQQETMEQMNKELKEAKAKIAILEREKNKYGLNFKKYPETGEAELLHAGQIPYLTPRPEHSTVKDSPQRGEHVLIEGDNLSALVALQASHKGKIDVIYIDPPYNTGNKDFVYNDSFVSNDDGYRHSKWLSFMERRLVLAKELLSETGVIFVSIDDNEQAPLKMLMDSVFGEQNFISNAVWQGGRKNNARFISVGADYFLVYTKSIEFQMQKIGIWREKKRGVDEALSVAAHFWDDTSTHYKAQAKWRAWLNKGAGSNLDDAVRRYSTLDGVTGKPMRPDGNLSAPNGKGPRYEVLHPITGLPCTIPGRGWCWTKERMAEEIRKGNVHFGATESRIPSGKNYLEDLNTQVIDSVFIQDRNTSNRVLSKILGKGKFNFPKDHNVLARWINYVSASVPNALILDFFAGSGTTGHAVAQLNAEDGGNRQCILVTNNFEEDGSPNGIARDVTAKRMKAVLTGEWADGKERETLSGNLHYYQIEFAPEETDFESSKTWAKNKRMLGLTSLKHSVFKSITPPEGDCGTLVSTLEKGQSSLLANENTLYAFWLDDSIMDLSSELVEEFTEEALALGKSLGLRVEFYVPSSDPEYIPDEDFFEDAYSTHTFPIGYINEISRVVKDLKGKQLLLSVDQGDEDDFEGEEGGNPKLSIQGG